MKLILLYREYCSLCKEMLEELKKYQKQYSFDIEIKDIDNDEDLLPQYDELVPVLLNEQYHEICHYHLNTDALLKELNARRNAD
ncbi:MAG: glutaredoxin family protein [Neisseriaceae bacterium]|nr:glutaredoxin family protein [Neisseriaceae bacterium]MBP5789312.1 glutaredoxin family protein [Neisseriaceae bacterium]MBQ9681905.1 glutaredoxin family protein [Neisseriaceae bacterium]